MQKKVLGFLAAGALLAGCATDRGGVRDDNIDWGPSAYPGAGPDTRPNVIRDSNNPSGAGEAGFLTPGRPSGVMPARPLGGTQ